MKKFENLGRKLSKNEQKNIIGGVADGGGQCYGCSGGAGQYSCWYSTGTCADLCARVYPDQPNSCMGPVGCMGCVMN